MEQGNQKGTTVETTGSPADFAVSAIPLGSSIIGTVISVAMGLLYLRRRISRDNLMVAKDVSEKRLMVVITEERDRAVLAAETAWRTRTEDAKLIGQLTAEVKHLTDANTNLIRDVAGLRQEISQLREIINENITAQLRRVHNQD